MPTSATQEVPHEEWPLFFDGFSRQHRGWAVTVEVFGPDIGAQLEAQTLAFEGIAADVSGDGREEISIMLGDSPDRHVTHTISSPTRVLLDRSGVERGAGEVLSIESSDGSTTLVRSEVPILPEQLDGIV
jgi:hypothetical protein